MRVKIALHSHQRKKSSRTRTKINRKHLLRKRKPKKRNPENTESIKNLKSLLSTPGEWKAMAILKLSKADSSPRSSRKNGFNSTLLITLSLSTTTIAHNNNKANCPSSHARPKPKSRMPSRKSPSSQSNRRTRRSWPKNKKREKSNNRLRLPWQNLVERLNKKREMDKQRKRKRRKQRNRK